MNTYYFIRSEQYSRISKKFYEDYLSAKYVCQNIDKIISFDFDPNRYLNFLLAQLHKEDDAAVAVLIFQAMAIESYANLMGAYFLDETTFYEKKERKFIEKKLTDIIKAIDKKPPADLIKKIEVLFEKRNALVHQKPRGIF